VPLAASPTSTPLARAGLSLIEVMLAISVLAIGVSSVFAHYLTLYQMRGSTKAIAQVQDVLRTVFERIVAADGAVLNTITPFNQEYVFEWSRPRYEDFVDVAPADGQDDLGRGPCIPPMTEADLLSPAFGPLMIEPTGSEDIEVFVEYYRGEPDLGGPGTVDDLPGILDPTVLQDPGDFAARFADPDVRDECRLDPDFPPLEQVAENQTVLIRVLVRGNGRRAELFTAKRRLALFEQ